MASITFVPRGPFDLRLLAGFGFGPDAGRPEAAEAVMRLAFCTDDLRSHAGVLLRQEAPDGVVRGDVHGDGDLAVVERQVARVLSLDHDGRRWLEVGERDRVIGRLQRRHPGLRPPLFNSPYEAAAWAIISARRRARQAAVARAELARRLGREFTLEGERHAAFPTPRALLEVQELPGLPQQKVDRLRVLRELPGIGPFYATLVLVRASGHADLLPAQEPRVAAAVRRFYALDQPPSPEALAELAQQWRPFRTWASVLLRYAGDRAGSGSS